MTKPIALHTEISSKYGHQFTTVRVLGGGELVSLQSILDGCIDNKAGFSGGQEVADRVAAEVRALAAEGYSHEWRDSYGESWSLTAEYQHYYLPDQYCDATISLGDKARHIARAIPTLNKLMRSSRTLNYRGFPESPVALESRFPKAVRVELVGHRWLVARSAAQLKAAV